LPGKSVAERQKENSGGMCLHGNDISMPWNAGRRANGKTLPWTSVWTGPLNKFLCPEGKPKTIIVCPLLAGTGGAALLFSITA